MATPLNEGGVLAVRKKKELTLAEKDKKKPNAIQQYFRETSGELRKVSWPTWPEARQLTSLVLVVMVIMGLLLGLVDALAHAALNGLLGL
jgi:preprotein translocase subunit SecE